MLREKPRDLSALDAQCALLSAHTVSSALV